MHKRFSFWPFSLVLIFAAVFRGIAADSKAAHWSWEENYAEVDPKGDLIWKPRPFVFQKGSSVRYVDFDLGDDANSGETASSAWKHHPWDKNANGKAASARGIDTYVFKRGVAYRGSLVVKEAGRAGEPIRLTSDPAWGIGEAMFYGSERVTKWT